MHTSASSSTLRIHAFSGRRTRCHRRAKNSIIKKKRSQTCKHASIILAVQGRTRIQERHFVTHAPPTPSFLFYTKPENTRVIHRFCSVDDNQDTRGEHYNFERLSPVKLKLQTRRTFFFRYVNTPTNPLSSSAYLKKKYASCNISHLLKRHAFCFFVTLF